MNDFIMSKARPSKKTKEYLTFVYLMFLALAKHVLVISCLFILSCEGPKLFSVQVVDKNSKTPLDSVLVKVRVMKGDKEMTAYKMEGYTNKEGVFESSQMIGYGMSMRSWCFFIDYKKKNYISKTEMNRTEAEVELTKE